MNRIYAVPLNAPGMEALISKHCFGDCGKAIVGGLMTEDIGPLVPCKTDDCPFTERTIDYPGSFESEGETYQVILRKLI